MVDVLGSKFAFHNKIDGLMDGRLGFEVWLE